MDGVLAMVGNGMGEESCSMKSLKRFCEGGWERRGGCVCMWLQGNPRPFFDGLKEQQISGAESSKSRTWYLKSRIRATDITISTDISGE